MDDSITLKLNEKLFNEHISTVQNDINLIKQFNQSQNKYVSSVISEFDLDSFENSLKNYQNFLKDFYIKLKETRSSCKLKKITPKVSVTEIHRSVRNSLKSIDESFSETTLNNSLEASINSLSDNKLDSISYDSGSKNSDSNEKNNAEEESSENYEEDEIDTVTTETDKSRGNHANILKKAVNNVILSRKYFGKSIFSDFYQKSNPNKQIENETQIDLSSDINQDLNKTLVTRRLILQELYVQLKVDLNQMIALDIFRKVAQSSCLTSKNVISKIDYDLIFQNLEKIPSFHVKYVEILSELCDDINFSITPFINFLMENINYYKEYLKNINVSLLTVEKSYLSSKFCELAKKISIPDTTSSTDLASLIKKPADIFCSISYSLNDLLKYTPKSNTDYKTLNNGQQNLSLLLEVVNTFTKDKKSHYNRLPLFCTHITAINEGKRIHRTISLFTDCIMCCKSKNLLSHKWIYSIKKISTKPFDNVEYTEVSYSPFSEVDCNRLKAEIGHLKSVLRSEFHVLNKSGQKNKSKLEKLEKEILDKEDELTLISPKFELNLYTKNGKRYILLFANYEDLQMWSEAMDHRSTSGLIEEWSINSNDIASMLDNISKLINKKSKNEETLFKNTFTSNALIEGLSGYIYLHYILDKTKGDNLETYMTIEINSYSTLVYKYKTKPTKNFEKFSELVILDVEDTKSIRLIHHKTKSKSKNDDFQITDIDLMAANLHQNFIYKKKETIDKIGTLLVSIHFSEDDLNISVGNDPYGPSITSICLNFGDEVPIIIRKCVEYVESIGIKEVGIYRISGVNSRIASLKKIMMNDPYVDLEILNGELHDYCGLIKMFFRELPEPLIPHYCKDFFQPLAKIEANAPNKASIEEALSKLPESNQLTLSFLNRHLVRVAKFENENKMGILNLSTVFGPSVFYNLFANDLLSVDSTDNTINIMLQVKLFKILLMHFANN